MSRWQRRRQRQSQHNSRDCSQRDRIAALRVVQHRLEHAGAEVAQRQPERHADKTKCEPLAEHHYEYIATHRAERHANAELTPAARD